MEFLILPPSDAAFRIMLMVLAQDPRYAGMPLRRVVDLHTVLRKRHVMGAFEGPDVRGVILWSEFPAEVGVKAVRERKLPDPVLEVPKGDAVMVLGIVAPGPDMVRPFWDAFAAEQSGKIILYERTFPDGRKPRFAWFDRAGRPMGTQLEA